MWLFSNLDPIFEFLGQFWYTKMFPRSHFSSKTSYLACTAFVFKNEISPGFSKQFLWRRPWLGHQTVMGDFSNDITMD